MVFRLSILLAMIALLAACGGTPAGQETSTQPAAQSSAPAATEQNSTSATAAAGAEQAFPVNITHKYGTTTIPAAPQRVVLLGYTDQDPILALGTVPVAVRYWFGDTAQAFWPWAQDALGDARPEILNMPFGELNIETIAALRPDLIIGVEEYTTLSALAPTVAQPADYVDFGVPWQEQTLWSIGAATTPNALPSLATASTLVSLEWDHNRRGAWFNKRYPNNFVTSRTMSQQQLADELRS